MYQTKIKGTDLFRVTSIGHGQPIELFSTIEKGDTPMSLMVTALASCVTMCVQGYYSSKENNQTMAVEVSCQYNQEQFALKVEVADPLITEKIALVQDYISQKCRVKALLREDTRLSWTFASLDK